MSTQDEAPADILLYLEELFIDADVDGSGELDNNELASLLHKYYKRGAPARFSASTQPLLYGTEKMLRAPERVRAEVDACLPRFDTSGNGRLSFDEFVTMFTSSETLKLKLSPEGRKAVATVAAGAEAAQASATVSDWMERHEAWRVEQDALAILQRANALFQEADVDGSGTLSVPEFTQAARFIADCAAHNVYATTAHEYGHRQALCRHYRTEGVSRSKRHVEREVQYTVAEFDVDADGPPASSWPE